MNVGKGWLHWISGCGVALALGGSLPRVAACPLPSTGVTNEGGAIAKIGFDLGQLDEHGLIGPPDGKRALDYEFCIPRNNAAVAREVRSIDTSLTLYPNSSGRIGCTDEQTLAIGNTHQENAWQVLLDLAHLDYVGRIEQVDWE